MTLENVRFDVSIADLDRSSAVCSCRLNALILVFFRFDTYALFLDADFLTQASLVFIKIICVFSLSVHVVVCSYKMRQPLSATIYRVVVVGTQFYQLRYTL